MIPGLSAEKRQQNSLLCSAGSQGEHCLLIPAAFRVYFSWDFGIMGPLLHFCHTNSPHQPDRCTELHVPQGSLIPPQHPLWSRYKAMGLHRCVPIASPAQVWVLTLTMGILKCDFLNEGDTET